MYARIHPIARSYLAALATGLAFVGTAALDHQQLVDDLGPALACGILGTAAGAFLYPRTKPSRLPWLPVCIAASFALVGILAAFAAGTCTVRYPGRCDFNGLMALPMGLFCAGFVGRMLILLDVLDARDAAARAERADFAPDASALSR